LIRIRDRFSGNFKSKRRIPDDCLAFLNRWACALNNSLIASSAFNGRCSDFVCYARTYCPNHEYRLNFVANLWSRPRVSGRAPPAPLAVWARWRHCWRFPPAFKRAAHDVKRRRATRHFGGRADRDC
jgi:hypothetical protein